MFKAGAFSFFMKRAQMEGAEAFARRCHVTALSLKMGDMGGMQGSLRVSRDLLGVQSTSI